MRHYPPPIVRLRRLSIQSRAACSTILFIAGIIVVLGWFREIYVGTFGRDTVFTYLKLFDSQSSLANWFEPALLLFTSILLLIIAALARGDGDRDWRQWMVLAGTLAFISLDESVNLHGIVLGPLVSHFGANQPLLWMSPALIAIAGLGAYFSPFLLRLPRRDAYRFIFCGAVFVAGAIGMEIISTTFAYKYGTGSVQYIMSATAEETLEIAGAALFFNALVSYIRDRWATLDITLT